jgi:hypothetical protein
MSRKTRRAKPPNKVAGYNDHISSVERDLTVVKWMVGTNPMLTAGVLGRSLVAH